MIRISFWRALAVLSVCFFGILFSIPTFLTQEQRDQMPGWFPRSVVNFGLDLQGGSHLLLKVDLATGTKDRLQGMLSTVRRTLRGEKIFSSGLRVQEDRILLTIREAYDMSRAAKALRNIETGIVVETVDDHTLALSFDAASQQEFKNKVLAQSLGIVERRINELGTKEPNIQRQGDDMIIVQLPGVDNPAQVREILGQTAKMTFRLVHPEQIIATPGQRPPQGYEALVLQDRKTSEGVPTYYNVEKRSLLGGENLVDAQVAFSEYGQAKVSFRFNSVGAREFAEITGKNVNRLLAIVLDDKVISAPRINGVIPGSGEITGQFTLQEASDLALLMRSGALPVPLTVVEERTVGPDLGADSIEAGQNATLIAMLMVLVFMIVAYALFGVFAVCALTVNLLMLVAVLAVTGSTLTLPGIAGIALTLGMAVDANVLIYERIKEELANGKKILVALDSGYKRAIATILDSNITTLIGAAALYFWGSGPIKGFGVTLTFGILISMFTAISFTRLLAQAWVKWRRPKVLSI